MGFPLELLALALSSYRWPRRPNFGDCYSRAIYPTVSIVAGSVSATYELKCLLLTTLDNHVLQHPQVSLEVFIDDIGQAATADTFTSCDNLLVCSALDLAADLMANELQISADNWRSDGQFC